MALLPNYHAAQIDSKKLSDYCLSSLHPIGKFKARVFKTVLGLTEVDAEKLKGIILKELGNSEAILTKTDLYGSRYTVDLKISNLGGHSVLRTAWIVSESDNIPRLITCFIK